MAALRRISLLKANRDPIPAAGGGVRTGTPSRRRLGLLLAAAVCLVLCSSLFSAAAPSAPSADKEETAPEYKIKGAFLQLFIQYISWPEKAFTSRKSPIVIGILGKDPFKSFLDKIVKGKVIRKRKIVVQRYSRLKVMKPCHILFISASEQKNLPQILKALKGSCTVTVSDTKGFAQRGVMINFLPKGKKITFEINLHAVKSSGPKSAPNISSKLLDKADKVYRTRKKVPAEKRDETDGSKK